MPRLVKDSLPASVGTEANRGRKRQVWFLLNICSLDAPIVAILWQILFEKSLDVVSTIDVTAMLALSAWLIYASDRLLDALRWHSSELAPRHQFCRRHWTAIAVIAMTVLFVLGWLCRQINPLILRNGLILLTGVIGYLGVVHLGSARVRNLWPKELVVGTIFSLGTCLPAWTLNANARREMILPVTLFALLCAVNCTAIEFREWQGYRRSDQSRAETGPNRLTLWMGTRLMPATTLLAIVSAIAFVAASEQMHPFFACCFLSSMILCGLAWRSDRVPVELLAILADAALFTPILVLALFPG